MLLEDDDVWSGNKKIEDVGSELMFVDVIDSEVIGHEDVDVHRIEGI